MSIEIIRKYTDIPALVYLLKNRKITLLDPSTWEDKNDSYFLRIYKEKKMLSSVLALCFSEATETYHHWKVFAGNNSGVCIRFNKTLLLNAIEKVNNIKHGPVDYRRLKDLKKKAPNISELPFIKRYAFRDECEYRIIYEDKSRSVKTKDIKIDLECIHKIILSPWIPKALVKSIKELLKSIADCSDIEMFATSINENRQWKRIGDSVA